MQRTAHRSEGARGCESTSARVPLRSERERRPAMVTRRRPGSCAYARVAALSLLALVSALLVLGDVASSLVGLEHCCERAAVSQPRALAFVHAARALPGCSCGDAASGKSESNHVRLADPDGQPQARQCAVREEDEPNLARCLLDAVVVACERVHPDGVERDVEQCETALVVRRVRISPAVQEQLRTRTRAARGRAAPQCAWCVGLNEDVRPKRDAAVMEGTRLTMRGMRQHYTLKPALMQHAHAVSGVRSDEGAKRLKRPWHLSHGNCQFEQAVNEQ
eukprot:1154813-Pleurochrysis_carterae.AAC.2